MSVFRLRLPATSANLGAAFDTAALALALHLTVEAEPAGEFSIEATRRNAELCAKLDGNLILETYCNRVAQAGCEAVPLALKVENEIPLGMGLGSSAASRLAGLALAWHFGELGWNGERILEEGCALEGHPDNAAACWLGGLAIASSSGGRVNCARVEPPAEWRAMMVMPCSPLATSKARAALPGEYSRADAVANIQAAALLGLAFAQGRGDLLQAAMTDRLHQPYRAAMCPLLPRLLPLAGQEGILGAALSGAGPSVLLVLRGDEAFPGAMEAVTQALRGEEIEILLLDLETKGAQSALGSGIRNSQHKSGEIGKNFA
jgi:homoserine kinase